MTSAVNLGVIGIFVFSLRCRFGKKDRHTAPFAALFHCSCHCSRPFLLISLATDVIRIPSNTMSIFLSSRAAALVSLSAASLPSIPMCAFTHLKCTVQFSLAGCRILFLIFSNRKPCIAWFLKTCVFSYTSVVCQRYRSYAPTKGLLTDDMLLVVYYWLPKAIEVRRENWL